MVTKDRNKISKTSKQRNFLIYKICFNFLRPLKDAQEIKQYSQLEMNVQILHAFEIKGRVIINLDSKSYKWHKISLK